MGKEKSAVKETPGDLEDKPLVKIDIGGEILEAKYREFKSGKKGYGAYGVIKVNDWPCRVSLNLIEM